MFFSITRRKEEVIILERQSERNRMSGTLQLNISATKEVPPDPHTPAILGSTRIEYSNSKEKGQ